MNVLILATHEAPAAERVRFWRARTGANDSVHVLRLLAGAPMAVRGADVHPLVAAGAVDWRTGVAGRIARAVPSITGPRDRYLTSMWPQLEWTVRSFDPDVVDVHTLRGSGMLAEKLRTGPWRVVADGLAEPLAHTSPRTYDSSLKVSIVLPVYNGGDYLRLSIDSCLRQSHQNVELVIVDDCSRDGSPAVIAEYAARDPRIVAIRNVRNRRLPGALNVGFAAATGDLLTWTSHDNYYASTAIEALVRYLCTWPDIGLVYSAYFRIDAEGRRSEDVNYLPPPWRLPYENVVGAYFMYRRGVYERVGGYREDMEYMEDYEYWARIYKAGVNLMRLPYPLYYYRRHQDSMTARADEMAEKPHAGERVRREHFQTT